MRVTTLAENTARPGLESEHGLSLYVETGRQKLLFDTGPGDILLRNAEKLGVDLSEVDAVILSHGHNDHAGGLEAFFSVNAEAPVYLHRLAPGGYYVRKQDAYKYIGIDRELLEKYASRFLTADGAEEVSEGVTLFSDIETSDLLSGANATLYKEENGAYVRDDFLHEQSALIRSGGKTALFAGCAHRGIVNILRRAEALCGKTPDWVLAGFHLNNAGTGEDEPEELVRAIGAQLDRRDAVFVTGHCTGEGPYKILKDVLGEKMRYMSSGTAFEL